MPSTTRLDQGVISRALRGLASQGWIREPSPLEPLEALATRLGVAQIWVKRDDALLPLGGGSKVRKLDLLLAQPLYRESEHWHTTGARGSGHLVACARAAVELDHKLVAHICPQPDSERVAENYQATRVLAADVKVYSSRLTMALRRPYLMALDRWRGEAIIPPGGTSPAGTAAFVRAAFELCDQSRALGIALPDRIYIPIGSGGAAVGLAVGLALAGAATRVHAIATVERMLLAPPRIFALEHSLLQWLRASGVPVPRRLATRLIIDNSQIGAGYAHPTTASRGAVARLASHGLMLESVYSGKAMAALERDARALSSEKLLFWLTCSRPSFVS